MSTSSELTPSLLALAVLLADPLWDAMSPPLPAPSQDGVGALLAAPTPPPAPGQDGVGALLAAPDPLPTAGEGVDAVALQSLLRRNRVSLLAAQRAGGERMQRLLAGEPLAAMLAQEEEAYRRVRREYATVRAEFARRGIKDVLIKSAGMAPSFPHLSDNVDDLTPSAQIPEARRALRGLGYVELRNLEEPRKFFFKRFSAGQEAAAHHLHELVGWAASFMDEEMVLQRARPAADDPEILIPHPEDALLITMAHAFYENKAIKLGDLGKVRHLLRSKDLDWPRLRSLAANKGWLDGLNVLICIFSRLDAALYGATLFPAPVVAQAERALGAGQQAYVAGLFGRPLALPLPISFGFSKRLFYAKCLHDRRRSAGCKLYDIVRHTLNGAKLKLKVHSQPGMLVTFSGVDGAGKTRHAQALVNALERCDIRTTYVWSRSGSSALTDAFVRLGKRLLRRPAAPAATQAQRASGRTAMLRNPLVRAGWSALVTLDLLWQYMVRVRLPLLVGRVVVCDRYTYDALADMAAVTGRSGSSVRHEGRPRCRTRDRGFWARLLVALSPRPSTLSMQGEGWPPQPPNTGGSILPASDIGRGGEGRPPQPPNARWSGAGSAGGSTPPSPSIGRGEGGEGRGEGIRASFVLTVAPSTAATRRIDDELSEATLNAQTALYEDIAWRHGLTALDNDRPFAEVNDELVRLVIRSYYARYRTLINGLFMANPQRSSQ